MFFWKKIRLLEGKVKELEKEIAELKRNSEPRQGSLLGQTDEKDKLTYSEEVDEWLNGERKGSGK